MLRSSNGSQSRLGELQELKDELNDMQVEIERIIKLPYVPNLNDGVLVTASPLWKLFRLPKWQKDLKTCWEELRPAITIGHTWHFQSGPIGSSRNAKAIALLRWRTALKHLCEVEQQKTKANKTRAKQASPGNEGTD